jgi:recombinational DNA repair protein (RecF pathway)
MRHKYASPAIVLSRTPLSEASALITLLTSEVGLVRARAQGVRKPGAKMASALQTFVECDVTLLRGKEGWRLAGALHTNDWFAKLERPARLRAGRIANLLLRLVHDETSDSASNEIFFNIFREFLSALSQTNGPLDETEQDAAECLAALRILHALGVDAGDVPGTVTGNYTSEILEQVADNRADLILRINRGIAASGL